MNMSTWCHIPEGQDLDVNVHRYTSGITVLSACEKVADKIKTCMKKASGRQQLCAHYWAVVIGNPQPNSAFVKVGLTFKENPCASNDKQVCVDCCIMTLYFDKCQSNFDFSYSEFFNYIYSNLTLLYHCYFLECGCTINTGISIQEIKFIRS